MAIWSIALGAASQSAAAVVTHTSPYQLPATHACLVSSHVALLANPPAVPYPQVVGELAFKVSGGSKEFILFARDPAHAIQLQSRIKRLLLSIGGSPAAIRRGLVRVGNVVFYPSAFSQTVNLSGTIRTCLK